MRHLSFCLFKENIIKFLNSQIIYLKENWYKFIYIFYSNNYLNNSNIIDSHLVKVIHHLIFLTTLKVTKEIYIVMVFILAITWDPLALIYKDNSTKILFSL